MNYQFTTIYCTNCGIEIAWPPEIKDGHLYCCLDCLHQLPCECASILEMEQERYTSRQAVVIQPASYPG